MIDGIDEKKLLAAIERASPSEKTVLLEYMAEIERRKTREEAQAKFMPFVRHIWPEFISGSHHARMARLFEDVAAGKKRRIIINLAPRHAIEISERIPTTHGFKTMGDLQVGDYVFGPDGLPTLVLGKSEVFNDRELYRVTTDDGFSIDVDGEHLWTVVENGRYETYTTEQLIDKQDIVLPDVVHINCLNNFFPRTVNRKITVNPLSTLGSTQCIKVAREDGLFLAGDGYICTHNTKSEFASYLLPAWFLGKFPKKKIMQISNTAELAEGFGRKVRNLVDSEEYKEIFPDVGLRSDSKAAGRWNTNQGGDYFATGVGAALAGRGADICIRLNSDVYEKNKGVIQAQYVELGDLLLGSDGYGEVTHIHNSTHSATVNVDGAEMSLQHPVWTTNRGWVDAGLLTTQDWLQSITWYDRLYSFLTNEGYHETSNKRTKKLRKIIFKILSHMVLYAATMLQPKCGKLPKIRSARNNCLRALESLRQLYTRHGRTANNETHTRQNRSVWELFAGKLSLGGHGNAIQQQKEQSKDNRFQQNTNASTVGAGDRIIEGYDKTQDFRDGPDSRSGYEYGKRELDTKTRVAIYLTERICSSLRVSRQYGEGYRVESKSGSSVLSWKEQIVLRVLLGIRKPKIISITSHYPEQFINFTVQGHNTFIVNPYLSHNCIVDDPHTEAEALAAQFNPSIYDKTYEWYTSGPRQRLQPGGALIIVMTRWHQRDLTGQIIERSVERADADQWEVIEFPAILPSGNPTWPEFWSIKELEAIRAEIPNGKWQAQYQQQPTSEQAAIIKRDWWQDWEKDTPPPVDYIIMAADTAFEAKTSADYSAVVVFGVWYNPEDNDQPNLILLNAWRDKLEFPELKAAILELYKEWQPDSFIIEKKASGAPLIAELRRMGISVQDFTPVRGTADNPNNKLARLHAIADIFASGKVWAPTSERWAEVLIDEVASFPAGKNDDMTDCVSMCLTRFRNGGFVGTNLDAPEEERFFRRKVAYY